MLWLKANWAHMAETVIHLANTYGAESGLHSVGTLSVLEAQDALRRQRGNIWNAVIDAVEHRQKVVCFRRGNAWLPIMQNWVE